LLQYISQIKKEKEEQKGRDEGRRKEGRG